MGSILEPAAQRDSSREISEKKKKGGGSLRTSCSWAGGNITQLLGSEKRQKKNEITSIPMPKGRVTGFIGGGKAKKGFIALIGGAA